MKTIKVANKTREPIYRGAYLFPPNETIGPITVNDYTLSEIKACVRLQVNYMGDSKNDKYVNTPKEENDADGVLEDEIEEEINEEIDDDIDFDIEIEEDIEDEEDGKSLEEQDTEEIRKKAKELNIDYHWTKSRETLINDIREKMGDE